MHFACVNPVLIYIRVVKATHRGVRVQLVILILLCSLIIFSIRLLNRLKRRLPGFHGIFKLGSSVLRKLGLKAVPRQIDTVYIPPFPGRYHTIIV